MYAVDGRLTSAGVDMMRVFKKWHEPSLTDRLMDLVWFAFPASRSAVQSRFEGLVELAERAGTPSGSRFPVTETIRPLSASMMTCLRFPALSVVLPQLTEALVAQERAARSLCELADLVRPSTRCAPWPSKPCFRKELCAIV
jgi:hypothetical protein